MQNGAVLPDHAPQAVSRPTFGRNLTISTQTASSDQNQHLPQFVSGSEVGGHLAAYTRSSVPPSTSAVTSSTGRLEVSNVQSPMLPSPAPSDDQSDNLNLTFDVGNHFNVPTAPPVTSAPPIPSPSSLQSPGVLRVSGPTPAHSAPHLSSNYQTNAFSKRSYDALSAEQQKRQRTDQNSTSIANQAYNSRQSSHSGSITSMNYPIGSDGPENSRNDASSQSPQAQFLLSIDRFVSEQAAKLTNLDRQRCDLLKEGCKNDDQLYLLLHRMFCCFHFDNLRSDGQSAYDASVKAGLERLSGLIKPNSELSFEGLYFFAHSLSPLQLAMTKPTLYNVHHQQAIFFLQRLGESWKRLVAMCSQRGYPLFVEEMEELLLLTSPTLQSVVFRALHHMLSGSSNSFLGGCTDRLFNRNRQRSVERAITGSSLSSQQKQTLISNFGGEYHALLNQWARNGQNSPDRSMLQRQNPLQQALRSEVQNAASPSIQSVPSRTNVPLHQTTTAPSIQWTSGGRQAGGTSARGQSSVLDAYASQYRLLATNGAGPSGPRQLNAYTSLLRRPSAPVLSSKKSSQNTMTTAPTMYTNPLRSAASIGGAVVGPPNVSTGQVSLTSQDVLSSSLAHVVGYSAIPYQKLKRDGFPNSALRLYRFLKAVKLGPLAVGPQWPNLQYSFDISENEWSAKVKDSSVTASDVPQRQYAHGLLLFRLRCAQVSGDCREFVEDQWVVQDHVWPKTIFVTINGIHAELRKKDIYGKDFPVDLTPFILQGLNFIEISCLVDTDEIGAGLYAFAVEVVGVVDEEWIRQQPKGLPFDESLAFITRGLSSIADDDDLTVVDPYVSIDLVDPFMATIFRTPVRGKECLHRECFDLETYLQTRKAQSKGMPTSADDWKCPICRKDARPTSLVVDEFLVSVRQRLQEDNKLDAKALRVKPDGTWEAKFERQDEDKRIRSQTPGQRVPDMSGKHDAASAVVIDLEDD